MKFKNTYNWKFWFKIVIPFFAFASIFIFFGGQTADLFSNKEEFWNNIFDGRENDFTKSVLVAPNWSNGNTIAYLILRNAFMITTLGNVLAIAFFWNSAANNKNEGKGKFDNYKWGIMVCNTLLFIVISYNGSLIFTGAVKMMKWYNYVSWMCEHSIIQIALVIYFTIFYNKIGKEVKPEDRTRNRQIRTYFNLFLTSIAMVFLYNFIFICLGYILRAANTFPIFGDMSTNGYFPYSYMDFTNTNKAIMIDWLNPVTQFVSVMVFMLIEQFVVYNLFYWPIKKNIIKKRAYK